MELCSSTQYEGVNSSVHSTSLRCLLSLQRPALTSVILAKMGKQLKLEFVMALSQVPLITYV